MASSPIPESTPFQPPQGIHLLIALGVPTLAAHLAVFWVTGLGPTLAGSLPGAVYAVVLVFWASWRQRTHQGMFLKFWLWAVTTGGLYAVVSLEEARPWPETFTLWGPHLFRFFLALVQGQYAALWTAQLAPRARLFQLIEGFPEGKELEARVRDFQLDADFSKANQAALSSSLAFLSAGLTVLAAWSPHGRGLGSALLLAGFLLVAALVFVLFQTYRREMRALMYGWRFSLSDKVSPLGWTLGLAVLAGLGAWGLTAFCGPLVDWNALGWRPPELARAGHGQPPPRTPRRGPGFHGQSRCLAAAGHPGACAQGRAPRCAGRASE